MSQTSNDPKGDLAKSMERLERLRDEVRLKLHLASLDAKRRWEELEPQVRTVIERARGDVSEVAHQALHESAEALQKLRDAIRS